MARAGPEKLERVRRRRPAIALLVQRDEALLKGILEQSEALELQILDLQFFGGTVPFDQSPAGLIIRGFASEPVVREFLETGRPAVRVGHLPHPMDDRVPAVLPDLAASGVLAADHFYERGFRNLAYVGNDPWSNSRPLYDAFEERARERGCSVNLHRLRAVSSDGDGETFYERRARELGPWLAGLATPLGILGYHARMAGTICAICRGAGLAVPEDVAVLAVGHSRFECESAPVPLSAIELHEEQQGRQAVLLLHRLIHGETAPSAPIMVPPKGIVERHSTDVLAVADPTVASAMRFIWDHLDQRLYVADIARQVGVSRRKLERAFRQHLNRGIDSELRRKRLERCRELLRTTDMTVADIARETGFGSKDCLHRAFRQAFAMTPRQYRLEPDSQGPAPTGR